MRYKLDINYSITDRQTDKDRNRVYAHWLYTSTYTGIVNLNSNDDTITIVLMREQPPKKCFFFKYLENKGGMNTSRSKNLENYTEKKA